MVFGEVCLSIRYSELKELPVTALIDWGYETLHWDLNSFNKVILHEALTLFENGELCTAETLYGESVNDDLVKITILIDKDEYCEIKGKWAEIREDFVEIVNDQGFDFPPCRVQMRVDNGNSPLKKVGSEDQYSSDDDSEPLENLESPHDGSNQYPENDVNPLGFQELDLPQTQVELTNVIGTDEGEFIIDSSSDEIPYEYDIHEFLGSLGI